MSCFFGLVGWLVGCVRARRSPKVAPPEPPSPLTKPPLKQQTHHNATPHLQVTAIFNSSLEVAVTVFGESPSEGVVFHCADACVTVVVVDPEGGPSTIPFALDPQTPNQQLRYQVGGCWALGHSVQWGA